MLASRPQFSARLKSKTIPGIVSKPPARNLKHALYLTEMLVEIEENPDVLGQLEPRDRKRVAAQGKRRFFAPGEPLFSQGDMHDGIYVIETGLVRSFYVSASGRELTLAYWTPGHFVGGPQIFSGGRHMWTSIAIEPSEALWLPGRELRTLIVDIPDLALGVIEGLVYKGKCYSALLQLVGTRPMGKRLAHLVLTLAERHGVREGKAIAIERSFTHEQLAAMIGATRQWVSVTMERFEKQRLLRRGHGRLVVLDLEALRRRAN
jgi:CRP-like cAMP-binding protein